jgi:uncharacterized protein (TIGR00251 family)
MKIKVKVHPKSSQEKINKINFENYEAWLHTSAIDNKANIALIKLLEKYFKTKIRITSGLKSKNKIIEILK